MKEMTTKFAIFYALFLFFLVGMIVVCGMNTAR